MATADSVSEPSRHQSTNQAVKDRYSAAAQASEGALCCPVSYNPRYLKIVPEEIINKDYGCGDPSPFVNPGDTVLDLGSGGGKLCYIAAQIVGQQGKVIGVDCNADMLALARKYQDEVSKKIGYRNTDFRCGRIQDLRLNLELLAEQWGGKPLANASDWLALQNLQETLSHESPLIEDESVDCVVSNCVLNLVVPEDRKKLFAEIYRVLKVGGRAAISDIVADEDVPETMQKDGNLWSGCISGAWREDRFVEEFRNARFQGIQIAKFESKPWQTVNGIEFRSMTLVATKTEAGACLEQNQAVIYRGPFESIVDDDGHRYVRGKRTAVCGRTFRTLTSGPYQGQFIAIEPETEIPAEKAVSFDCTVDQLRDPCTTRGGQLKGIQTQESAGKSSDDTCCGDSCC